MPAPRRDRPEGERPRLAFTCGDPAGIGPETVAQLLRRGEIGRLCRPLVVGERSVWIRAGWRPGMAELADTGLGLRLPQPGNPSADTGRASFAAVRLAVRLAARRHAAGIVTAPVSKGAWRRAGIPYMDHTGFLACETGRRVRMILGAPSCGLWTVLVTGHLPLSHVAGALDGRGVVEAARALDSALKSLGARSPRLGLCALNPHAGEDGLFGREEHRLLPALRAARRAGLRLEGPIPADAAWRRHSLRPDPRFWDGRRHSLRPDPRFWDGRRHSLRPDPRFWDGRRHREGGLDGLVCLYHDQAMMPLKTAAGLEVVNWTVGLPFPRTSPGHGTAFDIAGMGKADARPTLAAVRLAAFLSRMRSG